MTTVNEVRSTFLDFFARNGHEVVASSPLQPGQIVDVQLADAVR